MGMKGGPRTGAALMGSLLTGYSLGGGGGGKSRKWKLGFGRANMNEKTWNVPCLLRTFITQEMKLPYWCSFLPLSHSHPGQRGVPRLLLNYSSFISRHLLFTHTDSPGACQDLLLLNRNWLLALGQVVEPQIHWHHTVHTNTATHTHSPGSPVDWAFQDVWEKAKAKTWGEATAARTRFPFGLCGLSFVVEPAPSNGQGILNRLTAGWGSGGGVLWRKGREKSFGFRQHLDSLGVGACWRSCRQQLIPKY